MKKIENIQKNNFLKKIFVKLCRLFGFEIIDQSTFKSPTLEKGLNETLSIYDIFGFAIASIGVFIATRENK